MDNLFMEVSTMQLCFKEFLYVSASPLHKVKIIKQKNL
jgi:hypothetical protein